MPDDTPPALAALQQRDDATRAFNHATIWSDGGITSPNDYDRAIRLFAAEANKQMQALEQLARIGRQLANRTDLYDERFPASAGQGPATVEYVVELLDGARVSVGRLALRLTEGARLLSGVVTRDD